MKNNRAFTLVELMISIVIIALMTAIIITNLTGAKGKSRDGQRISDIATLQQALGLYFDRCNQYPSSLVLTASNGNGTGGVCPGSITLASYISKIPVPPSGSPSPYDYGTNGSASNYSDYVLHVQLENPNSSITANGLDGTIYTFSCSSLAASVNYCVGPK